MTEVDPMAVDREEPWTRTRYWIDFAFPRGPRTPREEREAALLGIALRAQPAALGLLDPDVDLLSDDDEVPELEEISLLEYDPHSMTWRTADDMQVEEKRVDE